MKKFSVPCNFSGGNKVPFTIYVGDPDPSHHPLHFQSSWLGKERGGSIPSEIMESMARLFELAKKNNVSFEELCVYAINSLSTQKQDVSTRRKRRQSQLATTERLKIIEKASSMLTNLENNVDKESALNNSEPEIEEESNDQEMEEESEDQQTHLPSEQVLSTSEEEEEEEEEAEEEKEEDNAPIYDTHAESGDLNTSTNSVDNEKTDLQVQVNNVEVPSVNAEMTINDSTSSNKTATQPPLNQTKRSFPPPPPPLPKPKNPSNN